MLVGVVVARRLLAADVSPGGLIRILDAAHAGAVPELAGPCLDGQQAERGVVLAAGAGYYLPNVFIENLTQKRQQAIKIAFPEALDMLLICVQSGMSVEASFGKVAKEISNQCVELGEELSLTTAELSYLPDRRQAFENLAKRTNLPSVKAVTTALVQAERYGTPVSQALRVMAKENREMRITEAEKKAAALPAKLTVPMIVFFLPVLFLVILGPAFIKIDSMGLGKTQSGAIVEAESE